MIVLETFGESVVHGDEPSADGCIRITKPDSSVCYPEPVPLGHLGSSLKTIPMTKHAELYQ